MHIENVAVRALQPYAGNARTHSNKQIRQIARSIERFGFCNPILIDDNQQIIAGHGRVAAANLLGLAEVPVVRLSHLSEGEKRAYVLARFVVPWPGGRLSFAVRCRTRRHCPDPAWRKAS
jgi:ParB-like chromosome segregation protein Spo0J